MSVNLKVNKLTINKNVLLDILEEKLDKISEDTVNILKIESPVDNTTREKQKTYLAQGKRAWLMDNIESRRYWKVNRITKSSFGGGIKSSLTNPNPAVIALALGFISPLNKNAEPVERTKNGKFSEQSPNGKYALEAMAKSFKNNNVKYIKIKK